jgi:hypothetical protein
VRTQGKEVIKAVVDCVAGLEIVQNLISPQQTIHREMSATLHSLLPSIMVNVRKMKLKDLKSLEVLKIRYLSVD